MAYCFGYDPGGRNRHGVAHLEFDVAGRVASAQTALLEDAASVLEWMGNRPSEALGIDTLLAWSLSGRRACDLWLREQFPEHANNIVHQNSLYSSMTINGVMVARAMKLPLYESHPKLLRKTGLLGPDVLEQIVGLDSDHKIDAVIAAYSAFQGHSGSWNLNLFQSQLDKLCLPAGAARYPWPGEQGIF